MNRIRFIWVTALAVPMGTICRQNHMLWTNYDGRPRAQRLMRIWSMDIFVSHRYHISTEFCRCFSKLVTILVSPQNEHMVRRKATSFVSISCRSKGNDFEVLTGLRHSFFGVVPYHSILSHAIQSWVLSHIYIFSSPISCWETSSILAARRLYQLGKQPFQATTSLGSLVSEVWNGLVMG